MIQHKCACCGAPLKRIDYSTLKCEYCGSMYEQNNPEMAPIRIETFQNPIRTFCVREYIGDEELRIAGEDIVSHVTMRSITRQLAEALGDCIRLEREYDPCAMRHVITARVRVVEDKYCF